MTTKSIKSTAEIRRAFLDYFNQRGHTRVASSPLVPANDPTLLFTNAGMVQFKDVFLGDETRTYNRATSSQRCLRAGGKHNDLDQVGYTARHHTFFEMLGNFSFGNYFKKEAIELAWEFLTETLGLAQERLWVTVFEEDQEAEDIWLNNIGIDPQRLSRIGSKDNFWSMGDTGPCGPCSEIFYDHGDDIEGGPPGTENEDGDRYIEIWNLVFMQYDRDASGTLNPLPKPCVDTGMGLERLAAILQNVHSNYEIDLFTHLIGAAAKLCGSEDLQLKSLRVIADHIRACAFLIVDGVLPSNNGRGYVLRRIIRRAVRHGYLLGQKRAFFHKMLDPLVDVMGDAYPELTRKADSIRRVLLNEEQRFAQTLGSGMKILEHEIAQTEGSDLSGDIAFKLYDTYGFPQDLTADVAREYGLRVDSERFQALMAIQKRSSQRASQFKNVDTASLDGLDTFNPTQFLGYDQLQFNNAQILKMYSGDSAVSSLSEGQKGIVFLDKTPFYAESGGQVGDQGQLVSDECILDVCDTQPLKGGRFAHVVQIKSGELVQSTTVRAEVNAENRQAIRLNHSATHLLHAALREVLGDHVEQKGSLVDAQRLRFDFSHFEAVSKLQLERVELIVNQQIRKNLPAQCQQLSYQQAIDLGAMALFGEKYGDTVRVMSFGEFSVELCGGCHVDRSGDIGLIKISSESGIASGIRRMEAVTGEVAWLLLRDHEEQLNTSARLLKASPANVVEKINGLLDQNRHYEKELAQLKGKLASNTGDDLLSRVIRVGDVNVVSAELAGADRKTLRDTMDQLKNKLGSSVVVLASVNQDKVQLIAGVSKDLIKKLKAGALINSVAQQVGGRGGGRPDMAEAGGTQPEFLSVALNSVIGWVENQLNG